MSVIEERLMYLYLTGAIKSLKNYVAKGLISQEQAETIVAATAHVQ